MGSLASSLRWLLLVCIALAGCGGGGGGGGAGTSLSLSRSSVTFSALANDAPPAPQTVVATFVGDGLLVGYPPNESVPPWLSIEAFDDASPVTVRLSVTTTSMPAGTYNTTVRFVTGRENGDGVITRDVAVTYTVRRNITLSNNYLGYSITQGEAIPPAQILVDKGDARWDASSSASWITLIERPSGTGGDFEIRFDTSGLSPGFYTTTVNVVATDTTGGQASVSVNLNLNAPTLSVAPNILSFAARAGSDGVPAAQSVTPSTANGFPSPFSVGVAYQGTATGWLSVPSSGTVPTPVSVRPSTTALAPGRYLATLSFSNGGSSDAGNQVSVTYDVTAAQLQAAPASLRFDVDRETVDADLQSTLTFSDDGAPLTWSVFGPPPAWLEVLDTSGDTRTARTMRVRVRKDVIATMENKTYNQPLVIAYGNAATLGSFTSVPVSLNLALPEVVGVMPYTSVAGKLIRHALGGSGLGSSGSLQILVGGQPATDVTVDSDRLVHFKPPALAPGTYEVRIDNALGIPQGRGRLVVVGTQGTFGQQFIATDRVAGRPVPDAGRDAVFALTDNDPSTYLGVSLVRFQRNVLGLWNVSPVLSLTGMSSFDLSADGRVLWISATDRLYSLDPDNPASNPVEVARLPSNPFVSTNIARVRSMADGRVLLAPEAYVTNTFVYDPITRQVTQIPDSSFIYCSALGMSLDGSRAFKYDSCGSGGGVSTYSVGDESFRSQPVTDYQNDLGWGFDTDGRRIASAESMYDANFGVLAALPIGFYPTFSPDSRRLYTFRKVDEATPASMSVFDVSVPPVRAAYPLLQQVPLAQAGYYPAAAVSADGGTIFIGTSNTSTNGLLIVPTGN